MADILNLYAQPNLDQSFKRAFDVYDQYAAQQRQQQERTNLQNLFQRENYPQGTAEFLGYLWQKNPVVAQKFMQDLQLNTQQMSQPTVDNQQFDSSMVGNLQQNAQVQPQEQSLRDIYQPRSFRGMSQISPDEELKIRKFTEPYIKPIAEDFKNAKQLENVVNSMETITKKIGKKNWPIVQGYLPERLLKDPKLRKFSQLANELVLLKGNARKGQFTNYKAKLEQLAKVSLDQPYETVLEILNDLKRNNKQAFDTQRFVTNVTKRNRGIPPLNIGDMLAEYGLNTLSQNQDFMQNEIDANQTPPFQENGRWFIVDPSTNQKIEVEPYE